MLYDIFELSNMLSRVIWSCYIMFKPSQHPTFNMVYNMLYDMFVLRPCEVC